LSFKFLGMGSFISVMYKIKKISTIM